MLDPLSLRLGMSGIARRAHGTLRKFQIEINDQLNGLLNPIPTRFCHVIYSDTVAVIKVIPA